MQSLSENKNSTQEKNSCLSQRELLNYATGNLSEKEKKKVETHLLECESCILLYQDVLNKKESADRTGKYSDLFPEEDKKSFEINFIYKKQLLVAIALLLSIVVLYKAFSKFSKHSVKNENAYSPLSETQKATVEPVLNREPTPPPPVSESKKNDLPPAEKNKLNSSASEKKILNENKTIEKKPEEVKPKDPKSSSAESKKPIEKIDVAPANTSSKNSIPSRDSEQKIPSQPVAAFIKNYKISKSPDEPSGGNYTKELENIFKQIDQAQYKDALSETGKFSADFPGDPNAKYYLGYIYYQMQNNVQAADEMDWIINNHDKIFFEDARWYKALILNRTQKPDDAKKILNELASSNGSYSNKAKQLLELMEGK